MDKKYSIGTAVRYIGIEVPNWWEKGWIGKIVGMAQGTPLVYLPKSTFSSSWSTPGCPVTYHMLWEDIERVAQPGEQLLFSFMTEE